MMVLFPSAEIPLDSYRRILPHERIPADLRRRRWQLGVVKRTQWLFGHEKALNWLIRRKKEELLARNAGFAVPTSWGIAACGSGLQLDCMAERVTLRLSDWVGYGETRCHLNDHFLASGDWTPLLSSWADFPVAREAVELYRCALDYRATPAYSALLQAAESGRPKRRQQLLLDRPEHIAAYFERFVQLFYSIQRDGMLRCHQLLADGCRPIDRDIGVAIGANGEIYQMPGGQHRTAIARVLGLKRMPVEVRLVHVAWLRDMMAMTGDPPVQAIRMGIKLLDGLQDKIDQSLIAVD